VGTHWASNSTTYDWTEYLDASAYDGVAAHLVDSLSLGDWPHPVLVVDEHVLIGRSVSGQQATNPPLYTLETWTLADTGKFSRLGSVSLANPAQTLASFPGMIAAQDSLNNVLLFSRGPEGTLHQIAQGRPPGCVWYQLNRGDGDLDRGLFLPLDSYGVARIPIIDW
jgi:hypothetical protein